MAGLAGLTASLLCCMIDVFRVGTDSGVGITSPVGCPERLLGTAGCTVGAAAGLVALALLAADGILATAAGPFCFAI